MADTAPMLQMMAEIADVIDEHAADGDLGVFAVVYEVNFEGDDEDDPGATQVCYRCSDQRRWVQEGFFDAAKRAVGDSNSRVVEEDDEDGD